MEEVGASQPEPSDWQLMGARFLREVEGDQARASTPHPHVSQSEKPSASWAHGPGGPGVVTRGAPPEGGQWALRERLACPTPVSLGSHVHWRAGGASRSMASGGSGPSADGDQPPGSPTHVLSTVASGSCRDSAGKPLIKTRETLQGQTTAQTRPKPE